jgi:hypothetical protein
MLCFQRPAAETNSLVEIAVGAIFQNEESVGFGLEGVQQIDNVRMVSKLVVISKFLREFVNRKVRLGGSWGARLHEALDGNEFIINGVLGEEDHSEGSMVKKVDSFITSVVKSEHHSNIENAHDRWPIPAEQNALPEGISHALHCNLVM